MPTDMQVRGASAAIVKCPIEQLTRQRMKCCSPVDEMCSTGGAYIGQICGLGRHGMP